MTPDLHDHMRALFEQVAADIEAGRSNYWCPCHGTALTYCARHEERIAHAAQTHEPRRTA